MSTYQADVIVVGGGVGGVTAALAARRMGVRVLLLEKNPIPGGVATSARVHSMLTFHSCRGHRIIGGIPDEIIERLKTLGGTPGHILDTVGVAYSVTPTDPDRLAYVLQVMLEESGVQFMPLTHYCSCVVERGRLRSIRGIHPGGYFDAEAPVFIDASGDGTLAADAGAPFHRGRDGSVMPATLIFQVRGVNLGRIFDYMEAYPDEFHHETRFSHLRKSPAPGVSGFFTLWKDGNIPVPRDRLLFYRTLNADEVSINSTRVTDMEPLDPVSLRGGYRKALEQVYAIFSKLRERFPGFEESVLSTIAPVLGVREVRRIQGRYMLNGEDVVLGRRFSDEIAFGGFPVDIHLPTGSGIETGNLGGQGFYGIPYRTLTSVGVDNLLVVGKCFSSKFEAHASARVQATTMAMGQAAGAAAALSVKTREVPGDLPADMVREAVADLGGYLELGGQEELA